MSKKAFTLRPVVKESPEYRINLCIGGGLDIPTGKYEIGKYNDSLLNGGMATFIGVVGKGNNFKSTISDFISLSAMSPFEDSNRSDYDSESNITRQAKARFVNKHCGYTNNTDLFDAKESRWIITDATVMTGDEHFESFKTYCEEKRKDVYRLSTPYLNRDGTFFEMIYPTFAGLDSVSKWRSATTDKMLDESNVGDSDLNTLYMRSGIAKKQMLEQLPAITAGSSHYLFMTAHIGSKIEMDARKPPTKQMNQLKQGEYIKGVPDDITFLPLYVWYPYHTEVLKHDDTGAPLYPRGDALKQKGDTDLFIVSMNMLRSKIGPTGAIVQLIVSQQEGVLPALSQFHYIKINNYFGLTGSNQNYVLDLMPEIKLQRTTVRDKLDESARLCRAMHFTAELLQMRLLWPHKYQDVWCEPKVLYEDLKKLGYDWNEILDTRFKISPDHYNNTVRYLSTLDLLNMRSGTYKPYWKQTKE
jgi:hypothetical protein